MFISHRRQEKPTKGATYHVVEMPYAAVAFTMTVANLSDEDLIPMTVCLESGKIVDAAPVVKEGYLFLG